MAVRVLLVSGFRNSPVTQNQCCFRSAVFGNSASLSALGVGRGLPGSRPELEVNAGNP